MKGAVIHRIPAIPWYTTMAPGANVHRFYLDLLLLLKTFFTGWKLKPDIIHAHLHEGCAASLLLARLKKIPLILDAEGSLTAEMKAYDFPLSGSFRLVEKFLTRAADHVLTSTAHLQQEIQKTFCYSDQKCSVLDDSIDTKRFRPQERDVTLMQRFGLTNKTPVAIFLGTLNHLQGIDILLATARIFKEELPEMRLIIMGFPDERYWESICTSENLNNVIFTGKINRGDVPKFLSLGNIALASKRAESHEGNGKLLDYMAMGLPVVAFDTPINKELLGNDYRLIAPYDSSQFARYAIALIRNTHLSSAIGNALRDRVVLRYSEEIRKTQLAAIYASLSDPKFNQT
jgi:glycosyltransferase involved in cell wall biosynthesis